jgi:hypothetical protein
MAKKLKQAVDDFPKTSSLCAPLKGGPRIRGGCSSLGAGDADPGRLKRGNVEIVEGRLLPCTGGKNGGSLKFWF